MALTPLSTDLRGIELRTADRPSPLPTHFKHFNSALRARRSVPEACASARVTFRSRTDTRGKKERRREREREFDIRVGVLRRWEGERERSVKQYRERSKRGDSAFSVSHDFLPSWPEPLYVCRSNHRSDPSRYYYREWQSALTTRGTFCVSLEIPFFISAREKSVLSPDIQF